MLKIIYLNLLFGLIYNENIKHSQIFSSVISNLTQNGTNNINQISLNNGNRKGTICERTSNSNFFSIENVIDDLNGTYTSYPGGYRLIKANGCPGFDWTTRLNSTLPLKQSKVIKLPLQPIITKTKFYTGIKNEDAPIQKPIYGPIGITVTGISIFTNSDMDGDDAMIFDSILFDKCNGHVSSNGDYHYHSEPKPGCVFKDTKGQHSPLFGFMFDGIPIYGSLGDNGKPPKDLDECGGHVDKTFPFYHYHLPKDIMTYPYTINCLRGCIFPNENLKIDKKFQIDINTCFSRMNITQYDYSKLIKGNSIFFNLHNLQIIIIIILYLI